MSCAVTAPEIRVTIAVEQQQQQCDVFSLPWSSALIHHILHHSSQSSSSSSHPTAADITSLPRLPRIIEEGVTAPPLLSERGSTSGRRSDASGTGGTLLLRAIASSSSLSLRNRCHHRGTLLVGCCVSHSIEDRRLLTTTHCSAHEKDKAEQQRQEEEQHQQHQQHHHAMTSAAAVWWEVDLVLRLHSCAFRLVPLIVPPHIVAAIVSSSSSAATSPHPPHVPHQSICCMDDADDSFNEGWLGACGLRVISARTSSSTAGSTAVKESSDRGVCQLAVDGWPQVQVVYVALHFPSQLVAAAAAAQQRARPDDDDEPCGSSPPPHASSAKTSLSPMMSTARQHLATLFTVLTADEEEGDDVDCYHVPAASSSTRTTSSPLQRFYRDVLCLEEEDPNSNIPAWCIVRYPNGVPRCFEAYNEVMRGLPEASPFSCFVLPSTLLFRNVARIPVGLKRPDTMVPKEALQLSLPCERSTASLHTSATTNVGEEVAIDVSRWTGALLSLSQQQQQQPNITTVVTMNKRCSFQVLSATRIEGSNENNVQHDVNTRRDMHQQRTLSLRPPPLPMPQQAVAIPKPSQLPTTHDKQKQTAGSSVATTLRSYAMTVAKPPTCNQQHFVETQTNGRQLSHQTLRLNDVPTAVAQVDVAPRLEGTTYSGPPVTSPKQEGLPSRPEKALSTQLEMVAAVVATAAPPLSLPVEVTTKVKRAPRAKKASTTAIVDGGGDVQHDHPECPTASGSLNCSTVVAPRPQLKRTRKPPAVASVETELSIEGNGAVVATPLPRKRTRKPVVATSAVPPEGCSDCPALSEQSDALSCTKETEADSTTPTTKEEVLEDTSLISTQSLSIIFSDPCIHVTAHAARAEVDAAYRSTKLAPRKVPTKRPRPAPSVMRNNGGEPNLPLNVDDNATLLAASACAELN
ncbi:GPI-anchored surface protein, putative [Bodo saltans]|uniref:GPI-anchored surface protein, putative n=1 Tax=Bodo saltans TaxID=75058 RepID=A0A0S4JJ15_BODSA|nr:GPI-anchored surface protein, putative [Bodo saltans]|eukprot:CUG91456.1 GPI-anchored surface protein, putative [Bodo saltans]